MGKLLAYSGITAKIRSMQSRLLSEEDYEQLARSTSVTDAVTFLRKHPGYNEAFSAMEEHNVHRAYIERILLKMEYADFLKIYLFSNLKIRGFLNLYFLSFERVYLRTILRGIADQRSVSGQQPDMGAFFKKHASFDCDKVSSATTMDEFVNALQNTDYHRYLRPLADQGNHNLFDYEMAIDTYIFSKLWKEQKKRFSGEDLEILRRTYGTQFDLLNLSWIYRSKKYYHFTPAETYSILLPVHYKLDRQTLKALVEAPGVAEFQQLLMASRCGNKYFSWMGSEHKNLLVEDIYHALLYHIHRKEARKSPFSIAIVNSYLYRKHLETKRLVTILESIRYGVPSQRIIEQEQKYNLEVSNK